MPNNTKYTEKWCKNNEEMLFDMISNGKTIIEVLKHLGISKPTFYELCDKYSFWEDTYQKAINESKKKGFNVKRVGQVGLKTKIKESKGSQYKPFLGQHRARALFNQYIEKAENGCLGSASLVFEYLFAKQQASSLYQMPLKDKDEKLKAEFILNAMFDGSINVDSANKMLKAIEKKEDITEGRLKKDALKEDLNETNYGFYDDESIPLDFYND